MHPTTIGLFILTERETRYLVTIHCQKPEGGILTITLQSPMLPLLKAYGYVTPMILEGLLIRFIDGMFHTRCHATNGDTLGPLWCQRRFFQLNAHTPEAAHMAVFMSLKKIYALAIGRACPAP